MRGLVVDLDLPDAESAVRMAESVSAHVDGFKIGLGLLVGPGPLVISSLVALGKPVLVDAKLHDVPSQVHTAARHLGRHGARWVTVHVSGGQAMVEAAVVGLREGCGSAPGGILGVTVLTSLDRARLARVGIDRSPGKLVARMAKVADAAGCEGVVSSPHEVTISADVAPSLLRVTPGVGPSSDEANGRSLLMTPEEAIRRGADLLIVGPPITSVDDPAEAAARMAARVHDSRRHG